MYSFPLSENSVSSELLDNSHVDHKRLTQSRKCAITFDFKMTLGSTFVQRSILREILLYVTAVVCREREYSNAEELPCVIIYLVFRQNSMFCPFGEYFNLSILKRKICVYNWKFKKKNLFVVVFGTNQLTNLIFLLFATYPQNQNPTLMILWSYKVLSYLNFLRLFLFQQLDQLIT